MDTETNATETATTAPSSHGDAQDKTPFVALVIPVYNAEPFLRSCLESVAAQTFRDFQAICVDDASTDNSASIAREFAARDARFTVISHPYNQGAGAARNTGLDAAYGTYVTFLDSDDTLTPNAFELMAKRCRQTDADICCSPLELVWPSEGRTEPYAAAIDDTLLPAGLIEPFSCHSLGNAAFMFTVPSVCTKWYCRAFLQKAGTRFTGHRVGEDLLFTCTLLAQAHRVALMRSCYYRYNQEKESSLSKESGNMADLVETLDELRAHLDVLGLTERLDGALANLFLSHCGHALELARTPEALHAAFDACTEWSQRLATQHVDFLFPYYETTYKSLCHGTPETYLLAMVRTHQSYAAACERRMRELEASLAQATQETQRERARADELEASRSYRLGRALLKLPCGIKDAINNPAKRAS